MPQKTQPKPSTPARPASARANPYQRRGSREDLLDGSGSRGRTQNVAKPATPVRPASARAKPYHQRSRSREDLLDGDTKADRGRSRAVTNASRQRSASTNNVLRNRLTVNEDKAAQTSPPYNVSVFPGQLDLDLTLIESRMSAKPRKDEKPGRTRIPMPNHQRLAQSDSSTPLKRFDSGVDIATISPTESSIHGDEMWQNELLVSKMAAQAGATYSHSSPNDASQIQPSLNYNCFDDDDSEYF